MSDNVPQGQLLDPLFNTAFLYNGCDLGGLEQLVEETPREGFPIVQFMDYDGDNLPDFSDIDMYDGSLDELLGKTIATLEKPSVDTGRLVDRTPPGGVLTALTTVVPPLPETANVVIDDFPRPEDLGTFFGVTPAEPTGIATGVLPCVATQKVQRNTVEPARSADTNTPRKSRGSTSPVKVPKDQVGNVKRRNKKPPTLTQKERERIRSKNNREKARDTMKAKDDEISQLKEVIEEKNREIRRLEERLRMCTSYLDSVVSGIGTLNLSQPV